MSKKEPYALQVNNSDSNDEIFRLENDGKVFWIKDGKLKRAKIDKDLAQAFAYVVTRMGGYVLQDLIKDMKSS